MLRSVVAPLYMVGSVLLNYGTTLGITAGIFTSILKEEGVIYMIPVFIFIILADWVRTTTSASLPVSVKGPTNGR
jgi:uncharacterized membrane protein YdfJ with MMPL/SSD domain